MMGSDNRVIVEMKRHFQLRAIEWWSAGLMASWGFYSLLVPGMYQANEAMHGLLLFAPQHIWGLATMAVGLVRLTALVINGFWYRTPAVRWATSMVSALMWFLVTSALVNAPVLNPGVVVYGWHILADIYSAFRSASDYVEAVAQRQTRNAQLAETSNVSSIRRG